ncbi:MAG: hypothetical protein Q8Q06_03220 [bacterium]|nr:hypothetical protein [bacterium]
MPQDQGQKEDSSKAEPGEATLSCADSGSLAFYENLSQIPIKFVSISPDKDILTGQFASPTMILYNRLEFKITPVTKNEQNIFFETDGDWAREISRKRFLKKSKKDFWLITYLTINQENIICQAYQFKTWEALRGTYSQEAKFATDTFEFWKNTRIKSVHFYQVDEVRDSDGEVSGHRVYWIFVTPTKGVEMSGDDEVIALDSGKFINRIQYFADGEARIVDYGFFIIDNNTVFHTVELKNPRLPRVKLSIMELGMLRVRPKIVDKSYFLNRIEAPWTCFYDIESLKISRAVEGISPEENGENKNNGKNGEGDSKNDVQK